MSYSIGTNMISRNWGFWILTPPPPTWRCDRYLKYLRPQVPWSVQNTLFKKPFHVTIEWAWIINMRGCYTADQNRIKRMSIVSSFPATVSAGCFPFMAHGIGLCKDTVIQVHSIPSLPLPLLLVLLVHLEFHFYFPVLYIHKTFT